MSDPDGRASIGRGFLWLGIGFLAMDGIKVRSRRFVPRKDRLRIGATLEFQFSSA